MVAKESMWQKITRVVNGYLGKSVDYDNAYGAQCVDFARAFSAGTFEPIGTFSGSALNGWKSGSPFNAKWKRVTYTKGKVPSPGDIIFFDKTKTNPYGHVAVVWNNSNGLIVELVEQNAGSGNGDGKGSNAVTQRKVAYINGSRGNCLGWFTFIG